MMKEVVWEEGVVILSLWNPSDLVFPAGAPQRLQTRFVSDLLLVACTLSFLKVPLFLLPHLVPVISLQGAFLTDLIL